MRQGPGLEKSNKRLKEPQRRIEHKWTKNKQKEGRMGWEMEVGVQEGRDICIPVADSY